MKPADIYRYTVKECVLRLEGCRYYEIKVPTKDLDAHRSIAGTVLCLVSCMARLWWSSDWTYITLLNTTRTLAIKTEKH